MPTSDSLRNIMPVNGYNKTLCFNGRNTIAGGQPRQAKTMGQLIMDSGQLLPARPIRAVVGDNSRTVPLSSIHNVGG